MASTCTEGSAVRAVVRFMPSSKRSTVALIPNTMGMGGTPLPPLIRRCTIVPRSLLVAPMPWCASSRMKYSVSSSRSSVLASTS